MAKPSPFRLSDAHLSLLDDLAAAHGGVRTEAVRDCIAYWHRSVLEAGRKNLIELTKSDWEFLDLLPDLVWPAGEPTPDWSVRIAALIVMTPGGPERLDLARKIDGCGFVRGYAMWHVLTRERDKAE